MAGNVFALCYSLKGLFFLLLFNIVKKWENEKDLEFLLRIISCGLKCLGIASAYMVDLTYEGKVVYLCIRVIC